MSAQSWFSKKHGIATLVALGDKGVTRLTQVVHRQPARLLPMRGALAEAAGAAHVAIGSYGGGLVGGDKVDVTVKAQNGASLLLGTQASTKVYRTHGQAASQEFDCAVDAGSLLVYAPDPLVPFANSAYAGTQRFELQPGASLVAVDWVGAGRAICGERWTFKSYSSRTEVHLAGKGSEERSTKPVVVEAVSLQPGCHAQRATSFDVGGVSRDAAVSVIVSGPRTHAVAKRLHAASATLAQRRTGWAARDARGGVPSILRNEARASAVGNADDDASLGGLCGDIVLGVSEVSAALPGGADPQTIVVARLVAQHNDDVYHVLHHCLSPLSDEIGITPYHDRVHSSSVAAPPVLTQAEHLSGGRRGKHRTDRWRRPPVVGDESHEWGPAAEGEGRTEQPDQIPSAAALTAHAPHSMLRLMHLCDATLPTGGFAHSGGLEAALQLGLLGRQGGAQMRSKLRELGTSAVLSAAQQQGPFAMEAYAVVTGALPYLSGKEASLAEETLAEALESVHAAQHALLVANAPGCRASLQLGGALSRIAGSWVGGDGAHSDHANAEAAQRAALVLKRGGDRHGAVALGALCALLELPQQMVIDAFIYTSARDMLSAAVRLNLIGPLAAVSLQHEMVSDASAQSSAIMQLSCTQAAGSAPLIEAVHACHDLLERRIFQT